MAISTVLAQTLEVGDLIGVGTLGAPTDTTSGTLLGSVLSTAITAMTIVAAIWFLFNIIIGGLAIMNSDGDQQQLENARKKISTGLIGLIVIISATFTVGLLGFLLGIDNPLDISVWIDRAVVGL